MNGGLLAGRFIFRGGEQGGRPPLPPKGGGGGVRSLGVLNRYAFAGVSFFMNEKYRITAITADTTSANGVAQQTPSTPIIARSTNIIGISTRPFRMIDRTKDLARLPVAWKTVLHM